MRLWTAVLMLVVLTLCAGSASASVLVNGGFEEGSFTGWTTQGTTEVASSLGDPWGVTPAEGLYCARIGDDVDPDAGVGREWSTNWIGQTIDAMPAGGTLSFRYNVLSWDYAPWDNPGFRFTLNGNDLLTVPAPTEEPQGAPYSTGWREVQYDIAAGSGPVTLAFYAGNSDPSGAGDYGAPTWAYVDDVKVSAAPEPASLLLLGAAAGAGAIVRRRRKR